MRLREVANVEPVCALAALANEEEHLGQELFVRTAGQDHARWACA
jgi:hypothetical protein